MRASPQARILFLDMAMVEEQRNVVQRVVEATKHPANPVLPLGDVHEWDSAQARPWESRSVIYDEEEGLFKCWYAGTDLSPDRWWATGYAVSEDGVDWTKPRLGLHEYNGNSDNNICMWAWGPTIKDSAEADAAKQYKMIVRGLDRSEGTSAAYSSDGIHWTRGGRIDLPEWRPPQGHTPDIVVLLRDEQDPDPQRRFKIVWQTNHPSNKPGPETVRTKSLGYGPDIKHLRASDANPILHPNDELEQEDHFLMLAPYHGYYVMPYEYGWYAPNGTGVFGSYCADVRLAVSRDGERFQRVQPHQKVISRGRRGEWDDGFLVISDKPAIKNDTIYLYYAGNGEDWTSWPRANQPEGYRFDSTGSVRLSRMGLATLRRDGFVCMETTDGETPGSLTTGPIEAGGSALELTANVGEAQRRRSWIEVEVLDAETGEPLPGFGREDCVDLCRDGVSERVAWGEQRLSDVGVPRFKLRCWLYGIARLYALGFEER